MVDFKTNVADGTKWIGTMLSELYSPNIPVLFKACGFDYFIVDCEHGCFDFSMVANLAAVSKNAEIPMLVRIPSIARECITKYMDMGVSGIVVPMVSTAEEARQVVEYSRYAPIGKRGISTTRAHSGYFIKDLKAYMERVNKETVILVQIETIKGVQNVEEIVKTYGIDGVIVGPNDLSCDMEIVGQLENSMLLDVIKDIYKKTRLAGKLSGIITSNSGLMKECMNLEVQLLSWNSELGMIIKSATNGIDELKGSMVAT